IRYTADDFNKICTNYPNLTTFIGIFNSEVDYSRLTQLKVLKLICTYNSKVQNVMIKITSFMPQLEKLYLAYATDLKSEGIISIINNCKHLQVLKISEFNNIDDLVLDAISKCTELHTVHLLKDQNISYSVSEDKISYLKQHLKDFKFEDVSGPYDF